MLGRSGAVAIAAIAISGCGGDGGGEGDIPAQAAAQLRATASTIDQATREQSCEVAHSATTDLRGQVDALSGEVEPETYRALSEMVSSLDELLDVECPKTGTSDGEQEPPPAEVPVAPAPTTAPTTDEETEGDEPKEDEEDSGGGPPREPPGHGGAPPGQTDDTEDIPSPDSGEPPTGGLDTERRESRRPKSKQAKGPAKQKKDAG